VEHLPELKDTVADSQFGLANLAYNMRRLVWLHGRTMPA
jgi:hypothetical protein